MSVGAATMDHLSGDGAATVRIDEVIQAPDVLRHAAGQVITVYGVGPDVQAGQQATFYTDGLVFGESLVVHAKDVRPIEVAELAAPGVGEERADPMDNLHAQRAQERFDAADLVVTGKVKAVRTAEPAGAILEAAGAGEQPTRISEHEPVWNDAVIEVAEVHKGEVPGGEVVIRFPSSTDVKWYRAPKFEPGQEGVFILHKDEPKAVAAMAMTPAMEGVAEGTPYTALDPADFHPGDDPGVIESVIGQLRR